MRRVLHDGQTPRPLQEKAIKKSWLHSSQRQMLRWTTAGEGPRFALIVRHDDEAREAAYDRKSAIGRLDRALDEAGPRGWTVVSMKNDWKAIFPAAKP